MYSKDLDLVKFDKTGDSRYSVEFNAFCFPDWYVTEYPRSNRMAGDEVDIASNKSPWESKEEKVFFRGWTTGWDLDYYKDLSDFKPDRLKLLHEADPGRWPRLEMVL